jgi:DNA invertase Pin-like site-specific DNA recombinase
MPPGADEQSGGGDRVTRYGYLWVGALEHSADFQRDLLRHRGVDVLFEDISAHTSTPTRPQLTAVLDRVREGDSLTVWRLDRLASTVTSVLSLLELLGKRGVGVATIVEGLNTSGEDGRPLLEIIAAFTALDRSLARERTMAGVYAAKARGRVGGRPRALSVTNIERVLMLRDQGATVREIAQELGTSRATIYRVLDQSNTQVDAAFQEPGPSITLHFASPRGDSEAVASSD